MSKQKDRDMKGRGVCSRRGHLVNELTEREVREEGLNALAGISPETGEIGDELSNEDWDGVNAQMTINLGVDERMLAEMEAEEAREAEAQEPDWGEPALQTACEEIIAERYPDNADASEAA